MGGGKPGSSGKYGNPLLDGWGLAISNAPYPPFILGFSMKILLVPFLALLFNLLLPVSQAVAHEAQDNFTLSAGDLPGWSKLTAPAVSGRVYFFQMSADQVNWAYAPTVKLGSTGTPLVYEVLPVSGQRNFYRLHFTQENTHTAGATGDLDGDSLVNAAELTAGTDPFDPDTDSDGMPDGWELKWVPSLNPLYFADANTDSDTDGLTALAEFQLGTNPRKADTDGDGLADKAELDALGDPVRFDMPILSIMEYSREATLEDWREPTFANRHNWVSAWRNTKGSGVNGSGGIKTVWASPTVPANSQMSPSFVVGDFLDENVGAVPPLPAGSPLPWGTAQSTGTTLRAWLRQTWSWETPYRVQRVRVRQSRYFLRASRAMPMELKVRAIVTQHTRAGNLDAAWATDGVVETNTLTLPFGQMDSNEITFDPAPYGTISLPNTSDADPRKVGDRFYTISIQAFPYSPTLLDSDGDGLPNTVEASMGTLSNNTDTDSDGREDFLDFISTRPGALNPSGPRANPSSPTKEEEPLVEYTWRDGHICPSADFSKKSSDTNIAVHGSHWDFGDKLENVNPAPASPTQAMKDFWAASPVYPLSLPPANAPPGTILDETKYAGDYLRSSNISIRYNGGSPALDYKGGDSKETMFRLRRETAGPLAISRKFLIVDRQKNDLTSSTWVNTSITAHTLTIPANQTVSPAVSVTNSPLKLPDEIIPAIGKMSIREIIALPIAIVPDLNMAGVVGDTVPTANPGSTIKHFVTPRRTPDPIQHFVELKATGILAAEFSDQLVWEAGTAGSTAEKRKITRSTTGIEAIKVRLRSKKDNSIIDEMHVWVVWADCTVTKLNPPSTMIPFGTPINGGLIWETSRRPNPGWKFKFKIEPAAIYSASVTEKPNLMGEVVDKEPPGFKKKYVMDITQTSGDTATYKWDVSRQLKETLPSKLFANPRELRQAGYADIVIARFSKNDPVAVPFPSDDVEGNDDPLAQDEQANPYQAYATPAPDAETLDHAVGELTSLDTPRKFILHKWGQPGDRFSEETNFREFARLQLWDGQRTSGRFWFRISDLKAWHHYLDVTYNEASKTWVDTASPNSSSSDIGHPRP
jgi:Bacterial TSP3 repeat